MSGRRAARRAWAAALALAAGLAHGAADDYAFDAAEFGRKPYEIGGYVQLRQEDATLRPGTAFYKLNTYNRPQRADLGRTTAILELAGKLRAGEGTFDFRTHSQSQRDELAHDESHTLYEAAYAYRLTPAYTAEAGKRVLRWGKGYAFNPIGFVERPKDPNDPELAREGYWMATGDYILNRAGDLQTVALTPVLLPVGRELNGDFGGPSHLNPAAKLYLLYRDTDIDLAWQGKGSRPARLGADVSRNVTPSFEIHGEWARIFGYTQRYTDATGRISAVTTDATSYLVGLRYLTEGNTTWIAEYYRNGTGYTAQAARDYYGYVDAAFAAYAQTGNAAPVQKALALSQGAYGRPNAGSRYVYLRAQQKDALDIVYFQPAVTAMVNVEDRSYQVTPELFYTGIRNVELRFRMYFLHGGRGTDFGEKANSRKAELQARLYF